MMGKVLQFPTKTVSDWRLIEGAISDVLHQAKASDNMREQVTAYMKEHYVALNREFDTGMSLPFPSSMSASDREAVASAVQAGLAKIAAEIHQQSSMALLQLLATEFGFTSRSTATHDRRKT